MAQIRSKVLSFLVTALALAPAAGEAAESRTYDVALKGRAVGTAVLAVSTDQSGLTTYAHHSRLSAVRGDETAERILHEEVRARDGVFQSAWAIRISGDDRSAVSAWWDARSGMLVVRRGESVERVPAGDVAGVETLFDAPRRLIQSGAVGAKRRVFDLPDARVGWVTLDRARDQDGWAQTNELGVRVRSRWAPGANLPDAIELVDIGLTYSATGIEMGTDPGRFADLTGGAVPVEGTLSTGVRARLTPASAWPGLACAGGEVVLPESGPLCRIDDQSGELARMGAIAGPRVKRLATGLGKGTSLERAGRLVEAIDAALHPRVDGAGLWEADPEVALERGAGDCNEAVAVFLAAAPLIGVKARRRAGLVLDDEDPTRLWPHAWVEILDGRTWKRVDPSRGEAPAKGIYLDMGDGASVAGRLRAVAPALNGGKVQVVGGS